QGAEEEAERVLPQRALRRHDDLPRRGPEASRRGSRRWSDRVRDRLSIRLASRNRLRAQLEVIEQRRQGSDPRRQREQAAENWYVEPAFRRPCVGGTRM